MKNNNLINFLIPTIGLFFILIFIIATLVKSSSEIILILSVLLILYIIIIGFFIINILTKKQSFKTEREYMLTNTQFEFTPRVKVTDVPIAKKLYKKKLEDLLSPIQEKEKIEEVVEKKELSEIDKKRVEILKNTPKLLADIIKIGWLGE